MNIHASHQKMEPRTTAAMTPMMIVRGLRSVTRCFGFLSCFVCCFT